MTKIWEHSAFKDSNLFRFLSFVNSKYGLALKTYSELHNWSVENLENFWSSVASFFAVKFDSKPSKIIVSKIPFYKSKWFSNSTLSYSSHLIRFAKPKSTAIIYKNEIGEKIEISWSSLLSKVSDIKKELIKAEVNKGDVVVGYLLNHPDTIASFIATNSLGAIWSCCSPDFGIDSIVERFIQLNPKVLIAHRKYSYNGKIFNQEEKIKELKKRLKTIKQTILFSNQFDGWDFNSTSVINLNSVSVPFEHPIWVLFSSGTTGKPKAITHSTGGILIEQYKALALHQNVSEGDRFFWNTTSGWMMWNYALGSLLCGGILCIYDGAANYPDLGAQWRFAKEAKINHFGNGAPLYIQCMKQDTEDVNKLYLKDLKTIGSTGSPLSKDAFLWLQSKLPNVQIISLSGGTDVCSAFIGGSIMLPVYAGHLQCKMLGAAIESFDKNGNSIENQTGELVITKPMPSMPIFFWGDNDFKRYHESYFSNNPNVWTHGDWICIDPEKGIIMQGRSDATLNRNGIRIGTSEIYMALDKLDKIKDSLIIELPLQDESESELLLFVVISSSLNEELKNKIKRQLKENCSPRHIPNSIIAVKEIPYTISGKKMEIPIKKLFLGMAMDEIVAPGAMRNPDSLNEFIEIRKNFFNQN